MDEGLTRSVYELFEIILPVALLLLIGGGIFLVSNPDFNRAYIFEKEISYISSLTSTDTIIELSLKNTNYENLNVDVTNNKIAVSVNEKGSKLDLNEGTRYFGSGVKIENKKENLVIISK